MGKRLWFPVVSGPLAPHAAGLESWLWSRSYSPSAVANRLCQLDQLSRWLERRGLSAGELTDARAREFARSRREAGLVTWTSPQSVALLLEYLREIGVVAPLALPVVDGPLEELLAEYRRYLLVERRLSEQAPPHPHPSRARRTARARRRPRACLGRPDDHRPRPQTASAPAHRGSHPRRDPRAAPRDSHNPLAWRRDHRARRFVAASPAKHSR
jgi:hypothetical protein